ncbi:hypothetical protein HY971_00970 [Candidatus Kaiserbacteria bacterium]|nr:hypothetical protein [Candidatus Kaiserbacteria bacterium]
MRRSTGLGNFYADAGRSGRGRRAARNRSAADYRFTPPPSDPRALTGSDGPPYGEKVYLLYMHENFPAALVGRVPDREDYEHRRRNYHEGEEGCIVFLRGRSHVIPWHKLALSTPE